MPHVAPPSSSMLLQHDPPPAGYFDVYFALTHREAAAHSYLHVCWMCCSRRGFALFLACVSALFRINIGVVVATVSS